MRICYVCKAVDDASPTLANHVRWIRSLASKPDVEHVTVLTRTSGRAELPANVSVRSFGAPGWAGSVARFCLETSRLRRRDVDLFFVAQGGPYPALLMPAKLALRRPVYHWKAHPHVTWKMRFYARWCDDLVFTSTSGALPITSPKLRVVGQGIDTDIFRPGTAVPERDLVAVGRIAPVKRLDVVLRALAVARDDLGRSITLDVVGPCPAKDNGLDQELEALAAELGLSDSVRWHGALEHGKLPELFGHFRASVNLSRTAFDKSAGEAMAAGLPVVTSNECVAEILPTHLRASLVVAEDDLEGTARALADVVGWSAERREQVGRELRQNIVANHSLDTLFDKILDEIAEHRGAGALRHRPPAALSQESAREEPA